MNIDNPELNEQNANWKAPVEPESAEMSEKQKQWLAIEAQVDGITDRLGLGIDSGIKKSVVAFSAHEFPTSQSCEGHLHGDHGYPYPWVEIYVEGPEGWEESEEKQNEWRVSNLKEQQKMINLLNEFYQNRITPLDARLVFDKIGAYGGFRIQSMGAATMELITDEELEIKHILYQKEMNDFSEFLKSKFLEEK